MKTSNKFLLGFFSAVCTWSFLLLIVFKIEIDNEPWIKTSEIKSAHTQIDSSASVHVSVPAAAFQWHKVTLGTKSNFFIGAPYRKSIFDNIPIRHFQTSFKRGSLLTRKYQRSFRTMGDFRFYDNLLKKEASWTKAVIGHSNFFFSAQAGSLKSNKQYLIQTSLNWFYNVLIILSILKIGHLVIRF